MTKLASRGVKAAATFLILSIAFVSALVSPAIGLADEGGEGAPEGPALSFSPSPVSFAKTTVGTESTTQAIDVYNGSGASAPVDQVVIEGADTGDFKVTGGNCGQVEPDQHCSLWVAFAPGSAGAKTATLSLKLKEAPEQTVQLEGEAVPAQLAFTPGGYDFGIQRVNRGEGSANLQLTNVGEAATQLTNVGIGGPDTNNFWTNGGDCWGGRWLQPGESCNVQVGFNPWDTIAYAAALQASVNGATFTAPLTGSGGRAIVEPSSNPDFGPVTVGSAGPVEAIVLVNHGNLPGNFFIGIVAGGDSGSFRLLDEDCSLAPVPPSGTCTAHVRFVPQGAGHKSARMAFFGDDDGGAMVLLEGEGVSPAVTLAPSSFDFGAATVGARSAAHVFTVRNDGGAALALDGAALAGADPDQFALAGDECSGATLAPGAECLVRVRFVPDGTGAKAATLRVRGEAGAFTAALSGQGVADPAVAKSATPADSPPSLARRGKQHRFGHGDALSAGQARCLTARSCRKARALRARTVVAAGSIAAGG
jgi:hypothetical protein